MLRSGGVNTTTIDVQWSPPRTGNQNTTVTHYRVGVHNQEENVSTFETVHSTAHQFTLLHPNYHYTITVEAFTDSLGPTAKIDVQTLEDGECQQFLLWARHIFLACVSGL